MFTWIVDSKRVDRKIVNSGKVGKWHSRILNDGKLVNSSQVDSGIVKNYSIIESWIAG